MVGSRESKSRLTFRDNRSTGLACCCISLVMPSRKKVRSFRLRKIIQCVSGGRNCPLE